MQSACLAAGNLCCCISGTTVLPGQPFSGHAMHILLGRQRHGCHLHKGLADKLQSFMVAMRAAPKASRVLLQGWSCTQVFEGHSHYVMQVALNPKDTNTFASASLDRTVKVRLENCAQPCLPLIVNSCPNELGFVSRSAVACAYSVTRQAD